MALFAAWGFDKHHQTTRASLLWLPGCVRSGLGSAWWGRTESSPCRGARCPRCLQPGCSWRGFYRPEGCGRTSPSPPASPVPAGGSVLAACPGLSPTTLPGGEHPNASSCCPPPGRSTVTGRGLTWPIPRVWLLWVFSRIRLLGLLRTLRDIFCLCLCSRRGEAQGHTWGTSEAAATHRGEDAHGARTPKSPNHGHSQAHVGSPRTTWATQNPRCPPSHTKRGHQNTLPAPGGTRLCHHPLGTERPAPPGPGSVPLPSRLYLWRTHSNLITIIFSINCCWRCSR